MTRAARIVASVSAGFLLATAALHLSAMGPIGQLARDTPGDAGVLLPMLWLSFGITLALAGVVVGLISRRMDSKDRWILAVVSLVPVSGAALQIVYVGFVLPTAGLLLDGVLVLTAAALAKPTRAEGRA